MLSQLSAKWYIPVVLVSVMLAAPATAQPGDWVPGQYMEGVVGSLLDGAVTVGEENGLGLPVGPSVFAAFMQPQTTLYLEYPCEAGTTYIIFGAGDEDAADLDLEVIGPDGDPVALDDAGDARPVVDFTAEESDNYIIAFTIYEQELPSFAGIVVMIDGGYALPQASATQASDNLMSVCADRDAESDAGVSFHEEPGQWCLWGGVIEPGDSLRIPMLELEDGTHLIVGACEDDIDDLDLFLYEGEDLFGDDTLPDAWPIVPASTDSRSHYEIELVSAAAETWGLALVTALDAGTAP